MTVPSVMYEPCACPWCGGTSPTARYPALHVVDCGRCGLQYASPRPTSAAREALYTRHYFESRDSAALGYDNYEADRPQLRRTFRARLGRIERIRGGRGTLLDVGCATGVAVETALELGWQAEGIDLSAYAVAQGRDTYGLPLAEAEVDTWTSPHAPYDVVTMWDYIEHVPNPRRTLAAAARLVRPGGLLVLTTPDCRSWPARLFRERWMGYKRDEHLVYFSVPHLYAFLREAGFSPLDCHYVGKHISLRFFAERLAGYTPRLARAFGAATAALRLQQAVLYVNPLDIACVTAERTTTVNT